MAKTIIITSKKPEELGQLLGERGEFSSLLGDISLLFFGDGANSLIKGSLAFKALQGKVPASAELFVSKEDLEARGLSSRISESVHALDYGEIVELIMNKDSKVLNYG